MTRRGTFDPASFIVAFERQAAARPDRTAVVFMQDRLSYGELNRRANRLARLLRRRGADRAPVGVALERSFDMIVALLAVQKTGAAYVPMDPRFPAERLQFMLADSAVGALIASPDSVARFDLPAGIEVIDLVAEAQALDTLDASDLATNARARGYRLHHLYFGLDRPSQWGGCAPWRACELPGRDA